MTPYMKTQQLSLVLYCITQHNYYFYSLFYPVAIAPLLCPHNFFQLSPQDGHHLFSHFSQTDEVCLFILLKDAMKPRNNTPHLTFYWFFTSSGINTTKINSKGLLFSSLKHNGKINNTSETVIQIFLHRHKRTPHS